MTLRRRWTVLVAAAALTACGLSRPPVERQTYLLTATRAAPARPAAKPVAVKVRPMRAVPLYERKELVYRVDGERVVSDFYNEFAESPESMLTSAVITWLKDARVFSSVVEPGVPVDAPYALDGSIVALYGDLRDPSQPAAEAAVQFYLVRQRGKGPELVYTACSRVAWTSRPAVHRRSRPAITRRSRRSSASSSGTWLRSSSSSAIRR